MRCSSCSAKRDESRKSTTIVNVPDCSTRVFLAAIKASPARGVTLIGDANGRRIRRPTFTLLMKKAVEEAGLPARCVPHGLRKAIMRRLAESGSSAKEIAAISGHRTLKEIERYTAAADQARLSKAAMTKLRGKKRT